LKCHDNDKNFAIVQSCKENNHENDSDLYQRWEKETRNDVGGRTQTRLQMVPVYSLGQHVLVIEDDPLMRESEVRKENQPSCTLILL